jgi:hypothetical protein
MFKTKAVVHSLKDRDEVIILHEKNNNDVIAEYKGTRCTAIYNPFVGMFYVDDIYGVLPDQHKCPVCGDYVA